MQKHRNLIKFFLDKYKAIFLYKEKKMFSPEEIITTDKYRSCFPTLYYKTDVLTEPERSGEIMLGDSEEGVTQATVVAAHILFPS